MTLADKWRELYETKKADVGTSKALLIPDEYLYHDRLTVADLALQHVPQGSLSSVLDLGCGYGDILHTIRARGGSIKYTGVEALDHIYAEAVRRWPGEEFIHGDFTEMKFPQPYYGVVVMMGCLPLAPNVLKMMKSALSVDPGYLLISYLDPKTYTGKLQAFSLPQVLDFVERASGVRWGVCCDISTSRDYMQRTALLTRGMV